MKRFSEPQKAYSVWHDLTNNCYSIFSHCYITTVPVSIASMYYRITAACHWRHFGTTDFHCQAINIGFSSMPNRTPYKQHTTENVQNTWPNHIRRQAVNFSQYLSDYTVEHLRRQSPKYSHHENLKSHTGDSWISSSLLLLPFSHVKIFFLRIKKFLIKLM
jgi:hypothetical protein